MTRKSEIGNVGYFLKKLAMSERSCGAASYLLHITCSLQEQTGNSRNV